MSPTRRTFLKTATAGLALAPYTLAQSRIISTSPLGDNLYLLSGAGCNIVVCTGAEGVVMVDGGLAQNADALAQAVAALPNGGPVRTLFNTHWHPEQTGSNQKLGMAGATIIAQENTRLWLQQNITWPWNGQKFKKFPKIAQPNKTFYDKARSIPESATDTSPTRRTPMAICTSTSRSRTSWRWATPPTDKAGRWWIGGPEAGLAALSADCNASRACAKQGYEDRSRGGPVLSFADIAAQLDMYGDDLRSSESDAEQRAQPVGRRRGQAGQGIRSQDGQPR